ncbi:hypothetical protein [Thermococcus sp. LS1]|uniref:hypothetical protein n=1 Tax=Thermococcus sp. LS1 TaxID=1638259 RepID=UPI001F0FF767|nr:hypothetical protein [Thermococcus sp. LS1]
MLSLSCLYSHPPFGYTYYEKRAEVDDAKRGLIAVSNTALFCLTDIGALETMLENNTSEELVREGIGRYAFCSLTPSEASASLYDITGEECTGMFTLHLQTSPTSSITLGTARIRGNSWPGIWTSS